MSMLKVWLVAIMMMFSQLVFAQEANVLTKADIKVELIQSMKKDGYLSDKMAVEVGKKYITEADKKPLAQTVVEKKSGVTASDWLSWSNFMIVVGIVFLLVATSGILKKIMVGMWHLIVAVPQYVYQAVFLGAFATGLVVPEVISQTHAFYIALFSSFALIMVLVWILETYPKVLVAVKKLFNLGVPFESVVSFYGMVYFGVLAHVYHSSIFGFFAAVCLSGMLSFTMKYIPGVLFLDFKEKMLNAVVFGHLIVLAVYVYLFLTMPNVTKYYDVGIQYYCTIAMSVGLLVGSSPWYKRGSAVGYALLFAVLFLVSSYGYFFLDLKVISSIITCFFILLVLEWLGYIGFKGGLILGCIVVGASLVGVGLLMEKYSHMLVLMVN